jgi:hypothetical protein
MLSCQDDTLIAPVYKRKGFMDYKNPINPSKKKNWLLSSGRNFSSLMMFWFTAREARREGDFGFVDLRGLI